MKCFTVLIYVNIYSFKCMKIPYKTFKSHTAYKEIYKKTLKVWKKHLQC